MAWQYFTSCDKQIFSSSLCSSLESESVDMKTKLSLNWLRQTLEERAEVDFHCLLCILLIFVQHLLLARIVRRSAKIIEGKQKLFSEGKLNLLLLLLLALSSIGFFKEREENPCERQLLLKSCACSLYSMIIQYSSMRFDIIWFNNFWILTLGFNFIW